MQTQKVVIFDFDGTIADTFNTVIAILNDNRKLFKIDGITDKEKQLFRDLSLHYFLKEFKVNIFRLPFYISKVRKLLSDQLGNASFFSGIKELLSLLEENNIIFGIVTSNSVRNVKDFLIAHNINSMFSFVVSSRGTFGKAKTLRKLIKVNNFDKSRCIYVGDEKLDIIACKEVRLPICAVSYGYNSHETLKKADPDFLCTSVFELTQTLSSYFKL